MDVLAIFGLQFALSLVVFSLMAKWFVAPWLAGRPREEALVPLIVPHAFRHIGMLFLVPGVVAQPLPGAFAKPAAYGDLVAGVLAIVALIAREGSVTLAGARDALGTNRRTAQALLERLDRDGVTTRRGDERLLTEPRP